MNIDIVFFNARQLALTMHQHLALELIGSFIRYKDEYKHAALVWPDPDDLNPENICDPDQELIDCPQINCYVRKKKGVPEQITQTTIAGIALLKKTNAYETYQIEVQISHINTTYTLEISSVKSENDDPDDIDIEFSTRPTIYESNDDEDWVTDENREEYEYWKNIIKVSLAAVATRTRIGYVIRNEDGTNSFEYRMN